MDLSNHFKSLDNFNRYLLTFKNTPEKVARRTTIINTKLPVLAIYSKESKLIVKTIKDNVNIIDFLNMSDFTYYEHTMIYGSLLKYLKSFDEVKHYLKVLSLKTDNWATCDNLPFKDLNKKYDEELSLLSLEYLKSELPFERRIGFNILFSLINIKQYNALTFSVLNDFDNEDEYYVNMMIGWLLCELYIKDQAGTLNYLKTNRLNKQAINLFVQKCRDSFRVSDEDKAMLLKYKK